MLIGCLLHALYETSTSSTQQRFSPLASRSLQEAGLGVTRATPCRRLPDQVRRLRARLGRVRLPRPGSRGFILHRILAGAARRESPLLFFVGLLQSGLKAAGIELGWAGSISACWTDALGSVLDRAGSAAE